MKYKNYEFIDDVLYDSDGNKISEEECWNGIPQLRVTKEGFHKKVTRWMTEYFPYYSNHLMGNSEIVFQAAQGLSKYRNKKILIVGGGPTTNECQWENWKKFLSV